MLELLTSPEAWIAFATLTALELVLGIDNIIFISILVDKLPKERREFARKLGLFMAMFMRIGLLLVLAWIVGLVEPLFTVFRQEISGRDLILILGGLFLVWKSTTEIHHSLEGVEGEASTAVKVAAEAASNPDGASTNTRPAAMTRFIADRCPAPRPAKTRRARTPNAVRDTK